VYAWFNLRGLSRYLLPFALRKLRPRADLDPIRREYYADFLLGVGDCAEFLGISIKEFIDWYLTHDSFPQKAWDEAGGNVDQLNRIWQGDLGKANLCANCVISFSLAYSYEALRFAVGEAIQRFGRIEVLDYGCANANLSFALLQRGLISHLWLCEYPGTSLDYVRFRMRKYGLEDRVTIISPDDRSPLPHPVEFIICMDVLEHLYHPTHLLKQVLFPALRAGGFLMLQAPWGGPTPSHLPEATKDFYTGGGRTFLKRNFREIYPMTRMDISGVWEKQGKR